MSDTEIQLTADDLRAFNVAQFTSQAENRTCFAYERVFVDRAKQLGENGDKKAQAICELMAILCSFSLRLYTPNEPYVPQWIFQGRRTLLPSDLAEQYHAILVEVVEEITDPELRARIADVLWVLRKGGHRVAEIAIDAYLESATILEDPRKWSEGAIRVERGLQLSAQLGRGGNHFLKTIKYIEEVLDKLNGEDPLWFSHKLMSLLLEQRQGCQIADDNQPQDRGYIQPGSCGQM